MSKLDGIKAGDYVKIVQHGRVVGLWEGHVTVSFDGAISPSTINPPVTSLDHFQITRIEPPFKVGDEVLVLGHRNGNQSVVGFLKDGRAIVEYQAGDTSNVCAYDISCLTHA